MRKFLSGLCATALAASFAVTGALPVNAEPIYVPQAPTANSDIQLAQYDYRHGPRRFDRRFNRRGDNYYFNGHRGYRHRRPGYREYNGWWFPLAAFAAGAIITGAVNNNRSVGNSHVQWCYNRYRSYRASDNTFQPYNGPRQQCYSPYN